jgi:SAM-dependent methyltransferase
VSGHEFVAAATELGPRLAELDRVDAIAAACPGSGNPASLAWLAEALALDEDLVVLDAGGGLGGAAAWLTDHYGCTTVCADPVTSAVQSAGAVFAVPAVAASGQALPFPDGAFDAVLLLGVLSVVDSMSEVLAEARRVGRRLGLLVYASTGPHPVEEGGSRFPSRAQLHTAVDRAGWTLEGGPSAPGLPPPPTWSEPADAGTGHGDEDELAVAREIADGRVEALVAVARRRDG